ncbi:hypothetical protein [Nonomuraea candida]|uniref:hypothetical protein n=1 Tax=Nonomuraea candida TaxID=359159 RepID=UPI001FE01A4F|nr:hypothetical protein [Nonomuraea candida]
MKHRVVVLGAGYAGGCVAGNLARRLSPKGTRITVVDAVPDFVQRMRLHQRSAAAATTAAFPVRPSTPSTWPPGPRRCGCASAWTGWRGRARAGTWWSSATGLTGIEATADLLDWLHHPHPAGG